MMRRFGRARFYRGVGGFGCALAFPVAPAAHGAAIGNLPLLSPGMIVLLVGVLVVVGLFGLSRMR